MDNSYILMCIKALDLHERNALSAFLASAFLNNGTNAAELSSLYATILEAAPDFDSDALSKENVYAKVYPDQSFVPGKLEKLMADFSVIFRQFVVINRLKMAEKDEFQYTEWVTWLREKGLEDQFRHQLSKLKNRIGKRRKESLEVYHQELMYAISEHEWESKHNLVKGDLGIPLVMRSLDLYYWNYRTELSNRYLLQQKAAHLDDLEGVNHTLEYYISESLLLRIAHKIQEVFKKDIPEKEEFEALLQLLQTHENTLLPETAKQFYVYLRNICSMLINGGFREFVPILHGIHKQNLEQGYFLINKEITPNVFLNLVQVAIRAGDTYWAKGFVAQYKGRIIGGDKEQFFYRYALASCLFAEGAFEAALNQLPDAPSGVHYYHMLRLLELKIYYELRSDLLPYKIDSFRKFIERTAPKVIAPALRDMHLGFLNLLSQLSTSPLKDKKRSEKLIERIHQKKMVAERAWLLEKAKELA